MPGDGLTHGPPATKKAGGSHHRFSRITTGIPRAMVLTAYSALSPVYRYSIHTFLSLRVVPYLIRRKASRPNRMTIGPGFP
jgi:hypothetical protein